MPTEAKNIRVHEYGKVQIDSWELESQPLSDQELIVKMIAAPINHADVGVIRGQLKVHTQFPFVPGFEGFGTITNVGKDLDSKLVNKKVFVYGAKGSFATHAIYTRKDVYVLDDDINVEGVSHNLMINPLTAAGLVNQAKDTKTKAVLVTAASSNVAKWITVFAHKNNIQVIALVTNEDTTAELKSLGADVVINTSVDGFNNILGESIEKLQPTVLLDALAGTWPAELLCKMPEKSVLINYGGLDDLNLNQVSLHSISNGKSIRGFIIEYDLMQKESHDNIEKLINKIYKNEKIPNEPVQEFGFEQAPEALEQYNSKQKRFLLKF